ncbi:MAG: NADH-quinone oxidoreductase subunit NuoN [Alphaproteobacteria bacterium]|nr:NADH-quinone oxidoreductase subunit NuoN [Alphaproteobacteria bacterium]
MENLVQDLAVLMPELVLAGSILVLMMYGAFRGDRSTMEISALAVLAILIAGVIVVFQPGTGGLAFHGLVRIDAFTDFMKVLVLAGAALSILMSARFLREERIERFEFPLLVLFATLGMSLMIVANDLISLYVALELQSLALYVLAAFHRDSARSSEAGLKYFVLGSLSSGLLLYGGSLVYGFTGATEFGGIAAVLASDGASIGLIIGLVFMMAGLVFKVSAVPFHMWTPDVYEGSPTPVTAFFAAAPKLAAMALLLRVLLEAFPAVTTQWQQVIIFVSIASMALGAFAAIGQTNIKRLMAYSSIANVGHMLVGLAPGTAKGVEGVLIYLAIYLAMTVGTFVCILAMRRPEGRVESINDLSGLARTQPLLALSLLILMFSLAGIPPLAGFFGKFYVYMAAVEAGLWPLAIIGILTTVVGAYYYIRIVLIIYNGEPAGAFEQPMPSELRLILAGTAAFNVFFVVLASSIIPAAGLAARALVN